MIQNLITYDAIDQLVDRTLDIYGQPCTLYCPNRNNMLGFEDKPDLDKETGVAGVSQKYTASTSRCWIEFAPKRSTFYRFNLNPDAEDNKDLLTCLLPFNSPAREGWHIITAIDGHLSVWGRLFFSVVKIMEEGRFRALKRTYFIRMEAGDELAQLLGKPVSRLFP